MDGKPGGTQSLASIVGPGCTFTPPVPSMSLAAWSLIPEQLGHTRVCPPIAQAVLSAWEAGSAFLA